MTPHADDGRAPGRTPRGAGGPVRLAVVDDYEIVRAGITAMLEPYAGRVRVVEVTAADLVQEDVDVVGLSILSGAHMTLVPRVCAQLKAQGLDDVLVTVGGIIPDDDIEPLREAGVSGVFGPGTTIREVADFIRANARHLD